MPNSGKLIDMTGRKYGKLTVLKYIASKKREATWICICDCGKFTVAAGSKLRSGHTRSCGCLKSELLVKKLTTHGESKTKLFKIYNNLRFRKKITMSYEEFKVWAIKSGYKEGLILVRKNNNDSHKLSNLKFITKEERNKLKSEKKKSLEDLTGRPYVANKLHINVEDLTDELYELKLATLKLHRQLRRDK